MKPVAKVIDFYGSKASSVKRYPPPLHRTIVEPFAGGASYSLAYPHHDIILIERDPVLFSIWKYLIKSSYDDIVNLPDIKPSQSRRDLDCCKGAQRLIGFWINSAVTKPATTMNKRALIAHEKNEMSVWGKKRKHHMGMLCEKIKHWQVINCSYDDFFLNWDATYFIDPPYTEQGSHYKCSDIDYGNLSSAVYKLKGQVIVCESGGADWLPFEFLFNSPGYGKISEELIYYRENQ